MMRKVKITKVPNRSAIKRPGRSAGFNSGQYPIYYPGTEWTIPPTETNSSLSGVPREQANLEAEGGETAYVLNEGGLPAHFTINGPRHSQGGVPLNLPPDSFIFSDTRKMNLKGPILEYFNKSKNGSYTPADISKQYDVNKYRKILQDPQSDDIAKHTAELMIQNYNKKLGALALVQEAKKGFPEGIPMAAMPYLMSYAIDPSQVLPLTPQQGGMGSGEMAGGEQIAKSGGQTKYTGTWAGPNYYQFGGSWQTPSFREPGGAWMNQARSMRQDGGSAEDQLMQVIQIYAQAAGIDPEEIVQQLQQMDPEEAQQTIEMMAQELQGSSQEQMQSGGSNKMKLTNQEVVALADAIRGHYGLLPKGEVFNPYKKLYNMKGTSYAYFPLSLLVTPDQYATQTPIDQQRVDNILSSWNINKDQYIPIISKGNPDYLKELSGKKYGGYGNMPTAQIGKAAPYTAPASTTAVRQPIMSSPSDIYGTVADYPLAPMRHRDPSELQDTYYASSPLVWAVPAGAAAFAAGKYLLPKVPRALSKVSKFLPEVVSKILTPQQQIKVLEEGYGSLASYLKSKLKEKSVEGLKTLGKGVKENFIPGGLAIAGGYGTYKYATRSQYDDAIQQATAEMAAKKLQPTAAPTDTNWAKIKLKEREYGGSLPKAQPGKAVATPELEGPPITDAYGNTTYKYKSGYVVVFNKGKVVNQGYLPGRGSKAPATQSAPSQTTAETKPKNSKESGKSKTSPGISQIQPYGYDPGTLEYQKVTDVLAPGQEMYSGTVATKQPGNTKGGYGKQDFSAFEKNNKDILDQFKEVWGTNYDKKNPDHVSWYQHAHYSQTYNDALNAGYSPEEATKMANIYSFDPSVNPQDTQGNPRGFDAKHGDWTNSRIRFKFKPKEQTTPLPKKEDKKTAAVPVTHVGPVNQASPYAPWWLQDVIGTLGAAGDYFSLKKYLPWAAPVAPVVPEAVYYDPTRELAANAEQMAIGTQGAGAFAGPQAYSARFSEIQGKGAANAANIMARYNNQNVGVANQFETRKADIYNRANQYNAAQAKQLYDATTIANQQYDNAKRQAGAELRKNYIAAITNRAQAQVLNSLYPNYQIDPSTGGIMGFAKGDTFLPGESQDFSTDDMGKFIQEQSKYGISPDRASEIYMQMKGYGSKGRSSSERDNFVRDYQGSLPS